MPNFARPPWSVRGRALPGDSSIDASEDLKKCPGRRPSTSCVPVSGSPRGEQNGMSLAATINAFQLHKVGGEKKRTSVGQDHWKACALLLNVRCGHSGKRDGRFSKMEKCSGNLDVCPEELKPRS